MGSVVIAALIAYRLAVLLAEEEGPFALAAWWRNRWLDDNWIGRGVRCVGCISFWLAASVLLLPHGLPWYLAWLATAGLARLIWRIAP